MKRKSSAATRIRLARGAGKMEVARCLAQVSSRDPTLTRPLHHLESPRHLGVQWRALGGVDLSVERFPHQRVRKRKLAGGVLAQQLRPDAFPQPL